jgi:hypothetical protein
MDAREIFLDELRKLGMIGAAVGLGTKVLPALTSLGKTVGPSVAMEAASRIPKGKGTDQGTSGVVNAR